MQKLVDAYTLLLFMGSLDKKSSKAIRNSLNAAAGFVIMINVSGIGIGSLVSEVVSEIDDATNQVMVKVSSSSNEENDHEEERAEVVEKEYNDDVSREYKSAFNKAESFANHIYIKKGVWEQLTSEYEESFSKVSTDYALDNLIADWKENVLNKANTNTEKYY